MSKREKQEEALVSWHRKATLDGKQLTILLNREPSMEESRMASALVVKGLLVKHRSAMPRHIGRNWEEVRTELGGTDLHYEINVL